MSTFEERVLMLNLAMRVAECLDLGVARTDLRFSDEQLIPAERLIDLGKQMGVSFTRTTLSIADAHMLLEEAFPIAYWRTARECWLFERMCGNRVQATRFDSACTTELMMYQRFARLIESDPRTEFLIAKRALQCASLSAGSSRPSVHVPREADHTSHAHGHASVKPLKRFINLLRLDWKDIWTLAVFAFVAGMLGLATPLAVEALVNVVSWGTYTQPLLVLAMILSACLGIAGILRIFQSVIVEMIHDAHDLGDLAAWAWWSADGH